MFVRQNGQKNHPAVLRSCGLLEKKQKSIRKDYRAEMEIMETKSVAPGGSWELSPVTEGSSSPKIQNHDHLLKVINSFFFFSFLGQDLRHMEVPRLGIESELQLQAYATAPATPDP